MAGLPALTQVFQFLGFGRYNSTPPVIGDGTTSELQVDQAGRLRVASLPEQTAKQRLSFMGASAGTLKNAGGKLWSMQGASGAPSGTTKYLQLFDLSTSLISGTTVPLISIPVSGQCNFADSFETGEGLAGLVFANGMQWAVSSTQFVYTADSTLFSVLAFYE